MKKITSWLYRLFKSQRFFYIILILFIIESVWIAISAIYPQAFDENFHFGVIQIYSHHLSPFLHSQPQNGGPYGAVARDPSYLYHFLMSFPYRLISVFSNSQTTQVIFLRLINIALLALGLVLSRKILLKVGISKALSNVTLFIIILIPIVPLLAGQINYDNLLIPLITWVILLTIKFTDQIKLKKPSIRTLLYLLILCTLTSLVKYVFLPIFLGILIYLIIIVLKTYRNNKTKFFKYIYKDWLKLTLVLKVFLLLLASLSIFMFIQRDGINIIKYHSIAPDCAKVVSIQECSAYSAWYFSYTSHQQIKSGISGGFISPIKYALLWLYWMWYRLFFVVNGPASVFTNYPPLPLPAIAGLIIFVGSLVSVLRWWKKIFKDYYFVLLGLVSIIYLIALFGQGFSTYRYTGVLENMNGRYLIPVIIPVAAIIARSISLSLRRYSINIKVILSSLMIILFIQGGGLLTYLIRSDDSWYFQNSAVQHINDDTRKIVNPLIIKNSKQYTKTYWFIQ